MIVDLPNIYLINDAHYIEVSEETAFLFHLFSDQNRSGVLSDRLQYEPTRLDDSECVGTSTRTH